VRQGGLASSASLGFSRAVVVQALAHVAAGGLCDGVTALAYHVGEDFAEEIFVFSEPS
jgi:hypothetical protein